VKKSLFKSKEVVAFKGVTIANKIFKENIGKIIYVCFVLLVGSTLFIACSKQENENSGQISSIKVEGIVGYDSKTKKVFAKEINEKNDLSYARENDSVYYETVSYLFTCDSSMPTFSSQEELELYLVENPTITNGVFELIIDDVIVYRVQIINGEKHNEEILVSTEETSKYPCTYAGIRACAVDTIHGYNWWDMVGCISAGFGCVVNAYGSLLC
jgi:hypothetical protein